MSIYDSCQFRIRICIIIFFCNYFVASCASSASLSDKNTLIKWPPDASLLSNHFVVGGPGKGSMKLIPNASDSSTEMQITHISGPSTALYCEIDNLDNLLLNIRDQILIFTCILKCEKDSNVYLGINDGDKWVLSDKCIPNGKYNALSLNYQVRNDSKKLGFNVWMTTLSSINIRSISVTKYHGPFYLTSIIFSVLFFIVCIIIFFRRGSRLALENLYQNPQRNEPS